MDKLVEEILAKIGELTLTPSNYANDSLDRVRQDMGSMLSRIETLEREQIEKISQTNAKVTNSQIDLRHELTKLKIQLEKGLSECCQVESITSQVGSNSQGFKHEVIEPLVARVDDLEAKHELVLNTFDDHSSREWQGINSIKEQLETLSARVDAVDGGQTSPHVIVNGNINNLEELAAKVQESLNRMRDKEAAYDATIRPLLSMDYIIDQAGPIGIFNDSVPDILENLGLATKITRASFYRVFPSTLAEKLLLANRNQVSLNEDNAHTLEIWHPLVLDIVLTQIESQKGEEGP